MASPAMQGAITLSDVIGDSPLYGYMLDETQTSAKWNRIDSDGTATTLWEDDNLIDSNVRILSGWMKDGVLCGFGIQMAGTYAVGFGYVERNVVTGQIFSQDLERYSVVSKDQSFNSAVYKKADDSIFGYGSYGNTMAFKKTGGDGDYRDTEMLFLLSDPYEWCPSLCVDPATGQTYGITLGQNESLLLKIDNEGFSDVIATLPVKSGNATSALAYFPETGYFLWSNSADGVSSLYAISISDGSCEKIADNDDNGHYGFFVTDAAADGKGIPEAASVNEFGIEAPATTGFISYTLPTNDLTAQQLEDDLEWVATLDKTEYATGSAAPGSDVTVVYNDLPDGIHTFGFYVRNGELRSGSTDLTEYIGYDTPLPPANVTLSLDGDSRLAATWEAVTEGVHGGTVDSEAIEYKVYLNDEEVATVNETSWNGEIDPDSELCANTVAVVASAHGMDSEAGVSNPVVAGKPLGLDVFFAPTERDYQLMSCPDDEGLRWKYNTSFEPPVFSVSSKYGSDSALDTWLIFPAINFPDASKTYVITYQNGTYADYDDEYYEIWIGREATVESMTTNILETTQVGPTDSFDPELQWNDVTTEFKVPEAGVWHIGFRACSEAHKTGQVLLNIKVSELSGVDEVESTSNARAVGINGCIVYGGIEGDTLYVYAPDGRLVKEIRNADEGGVTVEKGIYMVRAGERSWKLNVN